MEPAPSAVPDGLILRLQKPDPVLFLLKPPYFTPLPQAPEIVESPKAIEGPFLPASKNPEENVTTALLLRRPFGSIARWFTPDETLNTCIINSTR